MVMVPEVGFEPTLPCGKRILSPSRLPIPPLGHCFGKKLRSRTIAEIEKKKQSHSDE